MKPYAKTTGQWLELAERYFAAETTPQEEEALRRFLLTPQAAGREFDELRAVMGYLAVGRQEHRQAHRPPKAALRPWLYVAAAAILLLLILTPVAGDGGEEEENICVAYVHGKRCTDPDEVMRQMHRSMQNIRPHDEAASVESQLSDLFRTLQ